MPGGHAMSHDVKSFKDLPGGEHFIAANPSRDFCDENGRPYVMIKRVSGCPDHTHHATQSDMINATVKLDGSTRVVPGSTWVVPVVV